MKGDARLCCNYGTNALISHSTEVKLQILHNRIKAYIHMQISPEQTGFMPERGTRRQIMNVWQIIEKCSEFNITVMCFIDYTKAFDCVNWKKLFEVLREIVALAHIVDLVETLNEFNSLLVRADGEESEAFQAEQKVLQGCLLSQQLFSIYGEHIICEAVEH